MPELESSIEIDAAVEKVFDVVDDWTKTTSYMRGLVRWEPVDPKKTRGQGTRFAVTMAAGPVKVSGKIEVIHYERPKRIDFRSYEGPKLGGEWTFTGVGRKKARVDLRSTFDLPGGIAGRLVAKFVEAQGHKDLNASLADLKKLVEKR